MLTSAEISTATGIGCNLKEIRQLVCSCQQKCDRSGCLPPEIFNLCISEIQRACNISSRLADHVLSCDHGDAVKTSRLMGDASFIVQKVLLAVQVLCKGNVSDSETNASGDSIDEAIFGCHSLASRELLAIELGGVIEASSAIMESLRSIHESDDIIEIQRDCCTSVASGASVLARKLLEVARQKVVDYIKFSRNLAKLNYVLVRVFWVLVSKGYCADSFTNDAGGDGEGDVSGMNFDENNDGTGMGEGDGKKDVTDQLESEEQLLGLKGENPEDNTMDDKESKQLNEEEAKQGMEMEGDFEGDMFDVAEESQTEDQEGDEDAEELDREMGDGPNQNEDIIDEKMWDESDDEVDQNPAEEKFEKDSGLKGESLEDELRTREDDEAQKGGDAPKEKSKEAKLSKNDNSDEPMQDEPKINEDADDKYEEKASGVDVRDEQDNVEKERDGDEEPMELENDLNLDENREAESEEGDYGLETEGDPNGEEEDTPNANFVEDGDGDSDSDRGEVDADRLENGGHKGEMDEGDEATEDIHDDVTQLPDVEFSGNDDALEKVQGIHSKDGKDNIMERMDEDEHGEDNDGKGDNHDEGNANETQPQAQSGGTSGEGGDIGDKGESSPDGETDNQENDMVTAPNPLQNPGDASKFWHKKLQMLKGGAEEEEAEARNDDMEENQDGTGEFEYASKEQASTTQVLGEADEEDAAHLDDHQEEEGLATEDKMTEKVKSTEAKESSSDERKKSKNSERKSGADSRKDMGEDKDESEAESIVDEDMEGQEPETSEEETTKDSREEDTDEFGNRLVTDLSQLNVSGAVESAEGQKRSSLVEDEGYSSITGADVAAARAHWSNIQGETHHLARRLCEKLRLVMEPLVTTKLKGDYRTGKRINMKRVIGYIASGYRKDKIWLRRTKPAKRNYRVLLAVDNSESMHKSGAGEMALAAMATLAVGMSQLEIGELGVASFGEEMRLLHPFHQPFTSESGVSVVHNFPFDEKRTRTALCVESAISSLESQGDGAAMQLVFMISDGRIERDSRDALRRLVREMVERNTLLVMIIVEGNKHGPKNKKDSIVHMKEVTFKNGKPNVKQFIEEYPFPYYMVLEDMQALPELLGDALRQWFEMIAQIQGSSR